MNTKEKLEIAWKYLALILVAAIAFAWLETTHFIGGPKKGEFVFIGDKNHDFYGNEQKMMDVKVEKEIVDGDTLVKMWINGEEVDAEDHDMNDGSFKWKSKDGNVMVIDVDDIHDDHNEDNKEKDVRIIKEKIIMRDK